MKFVNPIEILKLGNIDIAKIDSNVIKKAKRTLQAEIELSDDGLFNYNGFKITNSDCDRVIYELEDLDKVEFYHFIANYHDLNSFLTTGNEKIFNSFRQESIFKLQPFIDLISPYFADQYDRALLKAYRNNKEMIFNKIISVSPLVNNNDKDRTYKSISNAIKVQIKEIELTIKEIKEEEKAYEVSDIDDILESTIEKFNVNIINSLPSYFQNIRNNVAHALRNLSVNIFNAFDDSERAIKMLSYTLKFNIDGLTNQNIKGDYNQINKIHEERIELLKHEPIIKKYADVLSKLKKLRDEIKNKEKVPLIILQQINSILSIDELNKTPIILNEIRDQIALAIRGISVEIWNTYTNIDISISIIKLSFEIKVDSETREELNDSLNQLTKLKQRSKDEVKKEIQDIIKIIVDINSQIKLHGMVYIHADKVKELLDSVFTLYLINLLATSNEIILKRNLFDELEKTLIRLDAFYSNNFLKKIQQIGANDGELAVRIEKNISGLEFKAKNVLNNVGTGVGKANRVLEKNLPPQIVGIIWLVVSATIVGIIIGIISSIFGN